MKYTLSILFVCCFCNLFAQSKWSVGVVGGVDLSHIHFDNEFSFTDDLGNLLTDNYDPSIQVRYGLNIEYKLNDHWALRSGVRVNSQGDQSSIDLSQLRWGNQHDGQGGFDPSIVPMEPGFTGVWVFKNRDSFLEVPLHLKYVSGEGKWQWYIEGGLSPNFYLISTSVRKRDSGEVIRSSSPNNYSDYNKITASVDLGFGFQRTVGDRMHLFIQPMVRYFMFPIVSGEGSFKNHFYNIGLELGLSLDLD